MGNCDIIISQCLITHFNQIITNLNPLITHNLVISTNLFQLKLHQSRIVLLINNFTKFLHNHPPILLHFHDWIIIQIYILQSLYCREIFNLLHIFDTIALEINTTQSTIEHHIGQRSYTVHTDKEVLEGTET